MSTRRLQRFIATSACTTAAAAVLLASAPALAAEPFAYEPPGVLVDGSGEGRVDDQVYAPGIRFPIEVGPAFANSQVWGNGGSQGPAGSSQCDVENRSYPWHDNYCETRVWEMPLCPAGTGHQGQDIRAATCDKDMHWVVAVTDGTITSIGTYSVYLTAEDGTRFEYLHMSSLQVSIGEDVKRGQRIGKVSNEFGGTPTTIHLHFNIRQNVEGIGFVYVPPYLSLVTAYQALINTTPEGELLGATCERVRGTSRDPDTADASNDVRVVVSGTPEHPTAIGFDVAADGETDGLCEDGAAPCPHGFDTMMPVALLDGSHRKVHVEALDTWVDHVAVDLSGSPVTVTCDAFDASTRVRRPMDRATLKAWRLRPFFDQLPLPSEDVEELLEGPVLPAAPRLVASEDGAELWIDDGGRLRPISEDALFAFRLDASKAEVWSDAAVSELPEGAAWPSRPVIALGHDKALYLLDDGTDVPIHYGPGETGGSEPAGPLGCACRAAPVPGGAGSVLGALVALFSLGFAHIARKLRPVARRRQKGRHF